MNEPPDCQWLSSILIPHETIAHGPHLEREREGHDDIGDHDVLKVDDEMWARGDAQEHPNRQAIEGQPGKEQDGVENRVNDRLDDIVARAGQVADVPSEDSHVWVHEESWLKNSVQF